MISDAEMEAAVLDWIEARRDKEQVISTCQCAEDLKAPRSRVVATFGMALRQDLVGWDQRCYYTIPRKQESTP